MQSSSSRCCCGRGSSRRGVPRPVTNTKCTGACPCTTCIPQLCHVPTAASIIVTANGTIFSVIITTPIATAPQLQFFAAITTILNSAAPVNVSIAVIQCLGVLAAVITAAVLGSICICVSDPAVDGWCTCTNEARWCTMAISRMCIICTKTFWK